MTESPVVGGSPTREQVERASQEYGGLPGDKVNDLYLGESTQEVPFSVYEQIKGMPLSAEFFRVDYDFIKSDPSRDIDKVSDKISFIESFVLDEMNDRGLTDTVSNYKKVITGYLGRISIDGEDLDTDKLLKLYKYIKLNKGYRNKIETILEGIK